MQTSFNAPAIRFGLDKTDLLPGQAQAPEGMPAPAPLSRSAATRFVHPFRQRSARPELWRKACRSAT